MAKSETRALFIIDFNLQLAELLPKPLVHNPDQPIMVLVGVDQDHQIVSEPRIFDVRVPAISRDFPRLPQHLMHLVEVLDVAKGLGARSVGQPAELSSSMNVDELRWKKAMGSALTSTCACATPGSAPEGAYLRIVRTPPAARLFCRALRVTEYHNCRSGRSAAPVPRAQRRHSLSRSCIRTRPRCFHPLKD
jgi:hypothetical protein